MTLDSAPLPMALRDAGDRPVGAFDEMVSRGRIRPHWQALVGAVRALPPPIQAERVERARRHFHQTGVTYNVYGDPRGVERPWAFDVLPLPLPPVEWASIEAGLRQRARLLNAVLGDLYGAQTLLRDRLYPAALVHANPRFLRPCRSAARSLPVPHVHVYAVDLVRSPDGQWLVLADRVDAPSGMGYALENRRVLARTMPEAFGAVPVRGLRSFFATWQAALRALAPRSAANPRIVLLTPGPYNETYFEHVYLARELGLTLAEGADLTVRSDRVYLKALGGLQPVDVILRRTDSEFCDPLELRDDSALGVSGLVQAMRAGSIIVANALGAGVIETPALPAFLPRLCRHLLGEELALPSVPVWWLGEHEGREGALARLDELIVQPAFAGRGEAPVLVRDLDQGERAALAARLARPQPFAIARLSFRGSTAPVWMPDGLDPRPLVLRVFLVGSGEHYTIMPGGLTRVSPAGADPVASMQQGGMSKDTWVLEDDDSGPLVVASTTLLRPAIRRSHGELPSRVAENLFWLGRYAERLDNAARLLRSALARIAGGGIGLNESLELGTLLHLLCERAVVRPEIVRAPPESRMVASALMAAMAPGLALDHCFAAVQRLAPTVRDRLSTDMWHVVTNLTGKVRRRLTEMSREPDPLIDGYDGLIGAIAAFGGMASENMTRHDGWRFLDFGRRIERGDFVIDIARAVLGFEPARGEASLGLVLELCDSTITYRTRYLTSLWPGAIFDLVLADEANPRSLAHQIVAIDAHLRALPGTSQGPAVQPIVNAGEGLLAMARGMAVATLSALHQGEAVAGVRRCLEQLQIGLRDVSDGLTRTHFSHVKAPQSVGAGKAFA